MKQELIIDIGIELFAPHGYRDVSIADIARTSGISVGSFYSCFSSKEQFYATVLDRLEDEGIHKADLLVSRLRSPINKLKVLYWFVALGLRHNRILRGVLLRDHRYVYPGLLHRERQKNGLRPHIERLVDDIIREGNAKGTIRAGLYRDVSRLVLEIFDVVVRNVEKDNFEILFSDLLVFMQRGLRRFLRLRRRDERIDRRLTDEELPRNLLR